MSVTSICSTSLIFYQYQIKDRNHHFSCCNFVVSKCIDFFPVQKFVVWKRVKASFLCIRSIPSKPQHSYESKKSSLSNYELEWSMDIWKIYNKRISTHVSLQGLHRLTWCLHVFKIFEI